MSEQDPSSRIIYSMTP